MTFEDYVGKKLIGSADELDQELYEDIDDDGDSISVTFGSMDYDEDDDNGWIVETGCIIYCNDDHEIDSVEPTARILAAGESGLGELDPDDWVDEERIGRILNSLTGSDTDYPETWSCNYWVAYGSGENSEDVDIEVPCTTDEYAVLRKLEYLVDNPDIDINDENALETAVSESDGVIESADDFLQYYDRTVEDCPELFDFIERVADAVYAARQHDCEMSGDENAGELKWSYGAVE